MKELTIEEKAKAYDEAYKKVAVRFGSNVADEIFIKESEDERIRKDIIWCLKHSGIKESNPINPHVTTIIKDAIDWLKKQGKQKPADKIEPKFKVGDWITNGDYTWKIVKVKPLDYTLQSQDANIVDDTISHVDEQFHSFTIEDAKDGDVLTNNGNIILFEKIATSERQDFKYIKCNCFTLISSLGNVFFEGGSYNLDDNFHPATKEQRDLLFSKMKEAGYEWNAEKKELKKIELQPFQWNISDFRTWQYIVSDVLTKHDGIGQYLDDGFCKKIAKYMQEEWSKRLSVEQRTTELPKGEDYGIDGLYAAIDILQKTLGKVDGYQTDDGILEHKCAISAVKELPKQQKPWSEEDGRVIDDAVYYLKYFSSSEIIQGRFNKQYVLAVVDELKSLKGRVGCEANCTTTKEWSEEDERERKRIIGLLEGWLSTFKETCYAEDCKCGIAWLKSLKPQPKQEWSEEDEKMIENIIDTINMSIEDCDVDDVGTKARFTLEKERDWLKNKLKSLRPQSHWRSSEEQMNNK